MPDHALELSFDEASARAIEAQWEALRAAGLPSQADHRSMTNAPHLTLVAASPIDASVVAPAADLIAPLLPAVIAVRGLLLLGDGPRITLAHLVEPDAALADAVARLRTLVPDLRHSVWTPHVTLARRVPRRQLARALEVLGEVPPVREIVADRLRWWDPETRVVETVSGLPQPPASRARP
ncbi:2'-5' RNA ligase family protein [Nocardioides sp. zg-ZUI104]|uniref:2'-5' RNA ligase family protein n=1 Tax=Nocardioides faecalis TaxID=2803858 RepID=UPI001BCDB5C0|nr:2'-5' RNA ligase family protein [Nocardioides faecalis]MBS4753147.1 2'-5' RNA ligase family protein [Nocardioides faecalis]